MDLWRFLLEVWWFSMDLGIQPLEKPLIETDLSGTIVSANATLWDLTHEPWGPEGFLAQKKWEMDELVWQGSGKRQHNVGIIYYIGIIYRHNISSTTLKFDVEEKESKRTLQHDFKASHTQTEFWLSPGDSRNGSNSIRSSPTTACRGWKLFGL